MGRGPVTLRRHGTILLLAAVLTLVADQVSKAAARAYLAPARSITLIPGVFELSYVRNQGAAFGMMQGQRLLFVATAIIVVSGVVYVWLKYKPMPWFVALALGFVAGGALGNLVDRVVSGRVVDFLYLHYWPVFNVADAGVVVGVTILVAWLIFHKEDEATGEDAREA